MSFIIESGKNILGQFSSALNQPIAKQSVKNVIGFSNFFFGCTVFFGSIGLVGRKKANKQTTPLKQPEIRNWTNISTKISLLLSGAVSPIGVALISKVTNTIFSSAFIEKFGPNTIFAINPWHPRHVVSLAAPLFAIPACIRMLTDKNKKLVLLEKVAIFQMILSRPVLHIGNQLVAKTLG